MIDAVRRMSGALSVLTLVAVGASCSKGPVEPGDGTTLVSVVPEGGEVGVDTAPPVSVTFDAPLMKGMEAGVALHRGGVEGAEVEGTWSFSQDRTTLVFTPKRPLEVGEGYTVHVGGAMRDREGRPVDYGSHGPHMGGEWVGAGECSLHGDRDHHEGRHTHMGPGPHHGEGRDGMGFSFRTSP